MLKIQCFLLSLLMLMSQSGLAQQYQRGDVNGDGEINLSDVNDLIDIILNAGTSPNESDWIDLGLPSGTIWAIRNVGADYPEDFGDYFAWGETEPKESYDYGNYLWCNGSSDEITKYCTISSYGFNGFVDDKTELDLLDDPAFVRYPNGRMPSYEQFKELMSYCTRTWTELNGVKGILITGPNGSTMFLPMAGRKKGSVFNSWGGFYWSRTLKSVSPFEAIDLHFESSFWEIGDPGRIDGFPVRAVRNR